MGVRQPRRNRFRGPSAFPAEGRRKESLRLRRRTVWMLLPPLLLFPLLGSPPWKRMVFQSCSAANHGTGAAVLAKSKCADLSARASTSILVRGQPTFRFSAEVLPRLVTSSYSTR